MTEAELIDAILRQSVELQRLSQGEEAKAAAILSALEDDLRALLTQGNLSDKSKREIEALIKEAHKAITGQYVNIAGVLDLEAVVQHVADQTVDFLDDTFPIAIGNPSIATLQSLSRDILIDGSPASAWWAKQAEDTAFKFAGNVRRGVLEGKTNEQIVRDVVADMDVSRRNARTLVHSSIMTAANQARLATYKKNMKGAMGVKWLATLDSHTCWSAETLITMADGTLRKISDVRIGDYVIGGVSGEPKMVIGTMNRVAQSSVVIHCDGRYVGRATKEHPILTPQGWREAGSFHLSSDISQREVLCRHHVELGEAHSGASKSGGGWEAIRFEQCVAEARRANCDPDIGGKGLRDGLLAGAVIHSGSQYESAERLQHDRGRGRDCGPSAREVCGNGQDFVAPILGGRRVQGQNANCAEGRCEEGREDPQSVVSNTRGPGIYCGAHEQPEVEGCHSCGEESPGYARCFGETAGSYPESVGRPSAAREDERSARGQAGRVAREQSGVGKSEGREGGGDHAGQVARPGVSGEDAGAQSASHIDREAQGGCCETDADYGQEWLIGSRPEVMGSPEGVSIGFLTATPVEGPVEVFNLTIEDDPTFIAGGILTHNCKTCGALDGSEWDFDGKKLGKTRMEFQAAPAHWACRCIMTPVPNYAALNEISPGLGDRLKASGERASSNGPIKSGTTFADFLKRQPDAWVREYLGAERAELYLSGKITLSDLVTKGGREKTLEELAR